MLSLTRLLAALAVIFAFSTPSVSFAATAQTTASVLAQARAAAGGIALDRVSGLQLSGLLTIASVKGRFTEWLDARSSKFSESDDAGPFSGMQGFDGVHSWNQDWPVHHCAGRSADRARRACGHSRGPSRFGAR